MHTTRLADAFPRSEQTAAEKCVSLNARYQPPLPTLHLQFFPGFKPAMETRLSLVSIMPGQGPCPIEARVTAISLPVYFSR